MNGVPGTPFLERRSRNGRVKWEKRNGTERENKKGTRNGTEREVSKKERERNGTAKLKKGTGTERNGKFPKRNGNVTKWNGKILIKQFVHP